MVRRVGVFLLVGLLAACAPKNSPNAPMAPEPTALEGRWFMLDTLVGPPSGRLVIEADGATLVTTSGAEYDFSYSREARGLELRGDAGRVVLAERAGSGALLVYGAGGAASIAYPIEPVDGAFLGEWRVRDPSLPAGRSFRVVGGQDGVARMVVGDRTFLVWQVRRPEGPAWVVLPKEAERGDLGRVWSLHAIDDGAWLVTGAIRGKTRVLHRPGAGPYWLGKDTGDEPPGDDPWLPDSEVSD